MTKKNSLKLDYMPERTRRVYQALAQEPLMQGFVLIGGTALSIQLGLRLSEDLDFWLPAAAMPKERVDTILTKLAAHGMQHEFATPAWKISQARIKASTCSRKAATTSSTASKSPSSRATTRPIATSPR